MNSNSNGAAIATVGLPHNGQLATATDFETSLVKSSTVTGLSPNQSQKFIEYLAQTQIKIVADSEGLTQERAILHLYLEYLDSQK